MAEAKEIPLDETVFSHPGAVAFYGGIRPDNSESAHISLTPECSNRRDCK
jgi:hypothetical protein